MDFLEIAKKRQSTRNFDPLKKVPQELLERCLSAMVLSPSACNAQPYFYYVLEGKKAKKAAKLTGKMNAFSKDAPVIIVVCEENYNLTAKIGSIVKNQDYKSIDIGISVAYLTSEATSLGLSTCIMGWFDEKELGELLKFKGKIRLVIALGYSKDDELREKKRKTKSAVYKILDDESIS